MSGRKARGGGWPMGTREDCSCRGGESSWQNVLKGGGRGTRRISPAPPGLSLTATPYPSYRSERDNMTKEQTTNTSTMLLQ